MLVKRATAQQQQQRDNATALVERAKMLLEHESNLTIKTCYLIYCEKIIWLFYGMKLLYHSCEHLLLNF